VSFIKNILKTLHGRITMIIDSNYNIGGSLSGNSKTYAERDADVELLNFCKQIKSNIHFVLAPRQMGKSSLKIHTISRLESEEIICVSINLQATAQKEKFWRTFTARICDAMPNAKDLKVELDIFWQENSENYSEPDCFTLFLLDKILPSLKIKKLVIFVDEVQALIKYDFQDEFVQGVTNICDDKVNVKDEILQKVSFVLIGVAKLSEFTRNAALNINQTTELGYLDLQKCHPLQEGLKEVTDNPSEIFARVFYWTNGQPFLTQLLCHLLVAETYTEKLTIEKVDKLVEKEVIKKWINQRREEREHFQEIQKLFLTYDKIQIEYKVQVLNYYEEKVFNQGKVKWQHGYDIHADLLMSGLVIKVIENDHVYLKVANPIYEKIFNYQWIDEMRQRLATGNVIPEDEELSDEERNFQDLDNIGFVNKCLKILQGCLKPFVKKRMNKYLGEGWENNREIRMIIRPVGDLSPVTIIDHQKLLTLIINYWENVFTHVFSNIDKCEIQALLIFCNDGEKQEADLGHDLAIKVLNTISYLLLITGYPSKAEQVDELMTNKYPEKTNYFLAKNRGNTLGYEQYQEQEENMVAVAPTLAEQTLNHQGTFNNMDRANRITHIRNQRQPRGEKVQIIINKLNSLLSQLDNMETVCSRFVTSINDASVTGNLSALFPLFVGISSKIQEVKQTLAKLCKRFSRKNLTIAFVGISGQGKSRLIQTLTGLTRTEVPDGTLNNCTGVKVIIAHSPDSQTRGEVYLHTPESFLKENIAPYYPVLHLGNAPTTLEQFINNPLPELKINSAKARAYYEYLERCKNNYSKYEHFLLESSPKPIGKDEIRKYVAQTNENNDKTNFNYLAVKEVKIYCQFPHGDVGQIALIDLPGLGDTVLGDRETLRRTLGEDVDFALFINMPKGKVLQEDDYELFDTANQALPELPIEKWSFEILNEVKNPPPGLGIADNRQVCEETKRRIDNEQRIKVAQCIIADCADPNEASDVLSQVLNYLETHILELDAQYAAIANKSIEQLEQEIKTFLEKARQAFRVAPKYKNENVLFYELADKLTKQISRNLQKLIQEIRPETLSIEKNQKDTEFFKTATKNIIKECQKDTGIHSAQKIDEIHFEIEMGGWVSVLERCINELRNHISKKFNSFDSGFEEYVEQVKNQISDALTTTDLGKITSVRGIDFLEFMAREIPEDLPLLKEAFEKLVSFKMTYEYHLEHLILQALEEELNPNAGDVFNPVEQSDEENIEIIHKILFVKHRNTVSKCRQALEKLEGMPSIIAYGRANRFVDEVLRSEGIKNDWLVLLQEWSSQVFPNHFGKGISQEKEQWENCIQQASSLSTLERI
jgi:energy-coupling factor transporter ATP-binding protein EcfA2